MQDDSNSRSKTEPISLGLTEISAEEGARVAADAFFNVFPLELSFFLQESDINYR